MHNKTWNGGLHVTLCGEIRGQVEAKRLCLSANYCSIWTRKRPKNRPCLVTLQSLQAVSKVKIVPYIFALQRTEMCYTGWTDLTLRIRTCRPVDCIKCYDQRHSVYQLSHTLRWKFNDAPVRSDAIINETRVINKLMIFDSFIIRERTCTG